MASANDGEHLILNGMLSPPRSHSTSTPTLNEFVHGHKLPPQRAHSTSHPTSVENGTWAPPMGRAVSTESDRPLLLFSPQIMEQQNPSMQIIEWELVPGAGSAEGEALVRANSCIDDVISRLGPNGQSEELRLRIVSFVSRMVHRVLGVQSYALGHLPLKTYLPQDVLEMTVIFPKVQDDTWFIKLNQALLSTNLQGNEIICGEVNFKHESRVLTMQVNGVEVSISGNRIDEISLVAFFERFDRNVGKRHLFKKTIILIKAWATYESRSFTGRNAMDIISGHVLAVMVAYIFDQHHSKLHTPLQAMAVFFLVFTKHNWSTQEIRLSSSMLDFKAEYAENYIEAKMKLQGYRDTSCLKRKAPITVVDPLDPSSNLAINMALDDLTEFKRLLQAAKSLKPLLQHIQDDA